MVGLDLSKPPYALGGRTQGVGADQDPSHAYQGDQAMNQLDARVRARYSFLIAVLAAAFSYDASATCGCSVTLVNGFAKQDITVSKIKTSDTGVKAIIFKNQWVGTRKINAGERSTFDFTVDGKCGNDHWFKFIKQDGNECFKSGGCGSTQTCSQGDWKQ